MRLKQLPRSQWDFADIPDEQMWICHDWEFSRTKLLMSDPCFVNDIKHWESDSLFSLTAPDGHFPPPWPHSAFAAIGRNERKEWGARLKTHQGLHPFSIQGIRESTFPVSSCENHADYSGSSGACHIAVFQIDWRFSKKAIRDSFDAWLNENEPDDVVKIERRGRQAPKAQEKENLEALGIFRIIKHHNLSIGEIIPIYEASLARRFSEDAAWSKAKKRAEEVLKSFH